MANTASPRGRGCVGRRLRALTRADFLTFLVAAMLCSASYCLAIWQNSRGAADSRILGPVGVTPLSSCVVGNNGARAADEPLDFQAHHAAESAGLSVSASSGAAKTTTTGARRALLGAGPPLAIRAAPVKW
ncbi:hypothetical protein BAE44_0011227 [Dichanthelium oligosanthes]|uniref:Uncharacterized protein n=1 Tax=Dichanthelium oligosanthes TaxID=888268 RepID=A0A1E5VRN8_9POAL|nr:hypothetical protein BAE44_0011227 [Dichanthelium oligosanthes]